MNKFLSYNRLLKLYHNSVRDFYEFTTGSKVESLKCLKGKFCFHTKNKAVVMTQIKEAQKQVMGVTKKGLGVKIKICYIQSQPIVLHSYYSVLLRCQLTERSCKKILRGISSVGRALAWHARGQRFEPAILHLSIKALSF